MKKNCIAFDFAPSHRTFDENGFLRVRDNHITKEVVNPYYGREIPGWQEKGLDPEKIYYGYRAGEELEKAVKTFEGLPLLMGHHVESAEEPQKDFRVGSSGTDAVWNQPYLDISLFVTDADAIRSIENGKAREISCAYMYDPDFTPGTFDGQDYDFVMRNIRGNHIALVEEGRAGADVVVADAQIKPATIARSMMKLFNKKFRGAQDEDAVKQEGVAQDGPEKLKAMFEALKNDGKITEEEFAALCATAFDEEEVKEEAVVEAKDEDEHDTSVRDAIEEAVEKIENAQEGGELDDEFKAHMKAAADACGLDAESPEFQKAFAEGVKYGEEKEKEEPKKLDSEHESEGMKKAMDEEEVKQAMDAAMQLASKNAHDATVKKFRALSAAADACRPVLGNIDALAYDSADDIYGAALRKRGVDTKKHPRAAWRSMYEIMGNSQPAVKFAEDAAFSREFEGAFAGLNNIRKA